MTSFENIFLNIKCLKTSNERDERTHISLLGVIQKVRSLRRGGGRSLKSEQKRTGAGGILACVYVRFSKKNAKISKMNFYSYSPVFPIDYNGSMKY